MTVTRRIALLTKNVDFTIKAKHGLERNDAYFVSAFTSAQNVLTFLENNPQELAIIDLTVRDISADKLLNGIRAAQPQLIVLVAPNHPAVVSALPRLPVQGIIDMPMPTRQLLKFLNNIFAEGSPDLTDTAQFSTNQLPAIKTDTTDSTRPDPLADELFQKLAAEEPPMPDFEESATVRDLLTNLITQDVEDAFQQMLTQAPDIADKAAPPAADVRDTLAGQILETAMDNSTPVNAIIPRIKETLDQQYAETTDVGSGRKTPIEELPPLPYQSLEYTAGTTSFADGRSVADSNDMSTDRLQPIVSSRPVLEGDYPVLPTEPGATEPLDELPDVPSESELIAAAPAPVIEEPTPDALTEIAHIALVLTEMSLETTADALILTRGERIIAYSGRIPRSELEDVKAVFTDPLPAERPSRMRSIRLTSVGMDFVVYSSRTENDFVLTMLFAGIVPFTAIRRQAKRINDAVSTIPELPAEVWTPDLHAAAPMDVLTTSDSSVLHIRVADDPREDADEYDDVDDSEAVEVVATPPVKIARQSYHFVWALRDPAYPLANDTAQAVVETLNQRLRAEKWQVENLDVYADFISMQVAVPTSIAPNRAIRDAMSIAAEAIEPETQRWASKLWADGYLVSPGARTLSMTEIQGFIQFARS